MDLSGAVNDYEASTHVFLEAPEGCARTNSTGAWLDIYVRHPREHTDQLLEALNA